MALMDINSHERKAYESSRREHGGLRASWRTEPVRQRALTSVSLLSPAGLCLCRWRQRSRKWDGWRSGWFFRASGQKGENGAEPGVPSRLHAACSGECCAAQPPEPPTQRAHRHKYTDHQAVQRHRQHLHCSLTAGKQSFPAYSNPIDTGLKLKF
jgi:hypothetical protein